MRQITFVTSNKGKMREAQEILGDEHVVIQALDLVEIQSMDIGEIARFKVNQAYEKLQQPVIVDDVGLYVSAWGGFPGPFVKFMTPHGSNDLLLRLLKDENDRSVILKAAIGFHDGEEARVFIGALPGTLAESPKGKNGWGFDPILIPKGYEKTFAEMGPEVKHSMSHRGQALRALKSYLEKTT